MVDGVVAEVAGRWRPPSAGPASKPLLLKKNVSAPCRFGFDTSLLPGSLANERNWKQRLAASNKPPFLPGIYKRCSLFGFHSVYFYTYPLFMASDADFLFMAVIKVSF